MSNESILLPTYLQSPASVHRICTRRSLISGRAPSIFTHCYRNKSETHHLYVPTTPTTMLSTNKLTQPSHLHKPPSLHPTSDQQRSPSPLTPPKPSPFPTRYTKPQPTPLRRLHKGGVQQTTQTTPPPTAPTTPHLQHPVSHATR